MSKNLLNFGKNLNKRRLKADLTLRDVCRKVGYDPSNWSKVERGIMSPPKDEEVLKKWADVLGIKEDSSDFEDFMDNASIAQGIIPKDILSDKKVIDYLPAFFRTVRNKKPTKEDVDILIKMINKNQ